MSGQIKRMIDSILVQRAKGDPALLSATKTKMILMGVNPDRFTILSPDDPVIMERIRSMAVEFGVSV